MPTDWVSYSDSSLCCVTSSVKSHLASKRKLSKRKDSNDSFKIKFDVMSSRFIRCLYIYGKGTKCLQIRENKTALSSASIYHSRIIFHWCINLSDTIVIVVTSFISSLKSNIGTCESTPLLFRSVEVGLALILGGGGEWVKIITSMFCFST